MDINVTLIGQMITFLIFVALTMKFIWPPISKSLQERRQKIADGLAAAERGKHELEVAHHKAKEVIREAKAQASVIVEQANHRSHTIEEEARQEARSIIEKMKTFVGIFWGIGLKIISTVFIFITVFKFYE